MPEGAYWETKPGEASSSSSRSGPVNFEVTVRGSEIIGVVQIQINQDDRFSEIADRLATEWNARKPIDLHAEAHGPLTAFFLEGELAKRDKKGNHLHFFERMAVTFPDEPRSVLNPTAPWEAGTIQVRRVGVIVTGGPSVVSDPSSPSNP